MTTKSIALIEMINLIGKSLQDGKYSLDRELGRGSFGITYRATNHVLNQEVVIKTSKWQNYDSEDLVSQFQDEARRLAKCSHTNIVRVSDFFSENGLPFIVMDYIPGLTLDRVVLPDRPLPEDIALKYIRQVAEALKVVHQEGLLHRDIKPKNLILHQNSQQVILIDFGIAREFSPGTNQIHVNLVSEGYAPIEQYFPEAERTPATDVYALAATLYTLLTAKVPPSAMSRYHYPLDSPCQFCPDLRESVTQAVMLGMAFELGDRPTNIDEWLALLPSLDRTTTQLIPNSEIDSQLVLTPTANFEEIDTLDVTVDRKLSWIRRRIIFSAVVTVLTLGFWFGDRGGQTLSDTSKKSVLDRSLFLFNQKTETSNRSKPKNQTLSVTSNSYSNATTKLPITNSPQRSVFGKNISSPQPSIAQNLFPVNSTSVANSSIVSRQNTNDTQCKGRDCFNLLKNTNSKSSQQRRRVVIRSSTSSRLFNMKVQKSISPSSRGKWKKSKRLRRVTTEFTSTSSEVRSKQTRVRKGKERKRK